MNNKQKGSPWWAMATVWGIVNAVNLLQSAGFLSRVMTGSRDINRMLGYGIVALSLPAIIALIAFIRSNAGWRHWIGPVIFLAFITLMIGVEYIWGGEFRDPMVYQVLVPYLLLFFGAIFWMGIPMFRIDRRLWSVTAVTTLLLLGSMIYAMAMGYG